MSRKFELCIRIAVLFLVVSMLLPVLVGYAGSEGGKAVSKKQNVVQDPIKLEAGLVSGKTISKSGKEVRAYLGIPYAAPPVGDLRWKPPHPVTPWAGVRDATQFSKVAAQGPGYPSDLPMDEDCLYLNVVSPAKYINEKLPVMVWLHPGAYAAGSSNIPGFNSYRLPQAGVIVVTVNTRIGVFGLLAHPLLSEESSRGVSGNYMFLDMIVSLKWVKKNIAAFGGDPDNVTIFGQSGGGWKVAALVASPLGKGLFKRGICQSGPAFPGMSLSAVEKMGENLFEKLGVTTLEAARKIPWEDIVKADTDLNKNAMWNMAIDGWFINDNPDTIFSAGNQNAVQMMVGLNQGELSPKQQASFYISGYVDMLSGLRKKDIEGYAYIFDQVPENWRKKGGVALHGMDISYIFGNYDDRSSDFWSGTYEMETLYGLGPEDKEPVLSAVDKKVSEAMMAMWTQFARTGNPSVKGLITVPSWEPDSDKYLYITDPLQIKSGFSAIPSTLENTVGISEKKSQLSKKDKEKLLGAWLGKPSVPEALQHMGEMPLLVFRFEMNKNDEFVGFLDMPDEGMLGTPVTNIEMNDDVLSFAIPDLMSSEFNGNLSGEEIVGKLKLGGPSYSLTLKKGEYKAQVFHLNLPKETMDQLLGKWNGACGFMGPVVYRFEKTENGDFMGFLDIPDQGAHGIQFTEAGFNNGKLVLKIKSQNGEFRGEFSGDKLVGEWTLMGMSNQLSLTKEVP